MVYFFPSIETTTDFVPVETVKGICWSAEEIFSFLLFTPVTSMDALLPFAPAIAMESTNDLPSFANVAEIPLK